VGSPLRYENCLGIWGNANSIIDGFGQMLAVVYGCDYMHSELYITAAKTTIPKIKQHIARSTGVDLKDI